MNTLARPLPRWDDFYASIDGQGNGVGVVIPPGRQPFMPSAGAMAIPTPKPSGPNAVTTIPIVPAPKPNNAPSAPKSSSPAGSAAMLPFAAPAAAVGASGGGLTGTLGKLGNNNAFMNAMYGLTQGKTWQQQVANAGRGAMQGRALDQKAALEAQKRAEEARQKKIDAQAMQILAQASVDDFAAMGITPEQARVLVQSGQGKTLANELLKKKIEQRYAQPKERRIIEGADGKKYYADTREPVLPGVEKQATPYTSAGKIMYELKSGLIDREEANRQLKALREGDVGGDYFEPEQKLRKEYEGLNSTKSFRMQTQAYQRVIDSAKEPSAAGDLALVFNYMKVLDPGSVVRESEFATAENAAGVPDRVRAIYNKVLSGERLAPTTRRDFVTRAGALYQGAAQLHSTTNERYANLASQYRLDPNRIIFPPAQIGALNPNFDIDAHLGTSPAPPATPGGTINPVEEEMRRRGLIQ